RRVARVRELLELDGESLLAGGVLRPRDVGELGGAVGAVRQRFEPTVERSRRSLPIGTETDAVVAGVRLVGEADADVERLVAPEIRRAVCGIVGDDAAARD